MTDKPPRSTFAERVKGRGELAATLRRIAERIEQRRDDDTYDDQPTPDRRKP
ncbi:hypothetical protein [Streptomyces sp. NPDC002853]